MSINVPLCQKFIEEFRRIHNLLSLDCNADTCQTSRESVIYLFDSLKEKQPEFLNDSLWRYRDICTEALAGGQNAGRVKIALQIAKIRIFAVFDALMADLPKRLEQLEREGKSQATAAAAKETQNAASVPVVPGELRNAIPAWVTQARSSRLDFDSPSESATKSKPTNDFTNNLALAQAEIKRLNAQLQAAVNTASGWKTKYDNAIERQPGISQSNEPALRSELNKLKAEHNNLAAEKDREKRAALASLQKSYEDQQEKNKIAHFAQLQQLGNAHNAEVERLKQENQVKLDELQADLIASHIAFNEEKDTPKGTQALAWLRARSEQGFDACPPALLDCIQGTLVVAAKLENEVSAEDRAWLVSDAPDKGLVMLEHSVYKTVDLAPALTCASLSADALLPRLLAVQLWAHRRLRETGIEMIRPLQGEAFQSDRHRREPDLVTTSDPKMEGRIHSLRQAGFYDAVNAVVLRPARVLVYHMAQTSIQTEDDLLKSLVR